MLSKPFAGEPIKIQSVCRQVARHLWQSMTLKDRLAVKQVCRKINMDDAEQNDKEYVKPTFADFRQLIRRDNNEG